jgi:N,N'-diacetyllegionaminate synthase
MTDTSPIPWPDVRRATIIAEVAQAHDGSLGTAHAFIDAAADGGVDAVKFQTHIARAESTPEEPWRVKFSPEDATRFDYWKRMEFSLQAWHGLRSHATERGLRFLSSPFSLEAVELLEEVGVAAWKIASGEIRNRTLFNRVAETGLPVLLSTGMSPLAEIDEAVEVLLDAGLDVTVLQCTSAYPTPPEGVGLNLIPFFRERYGCGVGLSDHSGTVYPSLGAALLGVEAIEVHLTLSRHAFGPDVCSSVTPEELRTLVDGVRFLEAVRTNPVDKDAMAEELGDLRGAFMRSLVASRDLPAGDIIGVDDLVERKPGTGVAPEHIHEFVGKRLKKDLAQWQLLHWDDVDEAP